MKIVNIESKDTFHVELRKSGGEEQLTCPECSSNRKKKKDKCFSWNHNGNVGFCHHCNSKYAEYKEYQPKKEYKLPEWKNNTKLSDNLLKYLEDRGITQFSIRHNNLISEGPEYMPQVQKELNTMQFNYFRSEELINVKYRTGNKLFKLAKDAELIFFNLDGIKDQKTAIITEGEFDALTFIECGFKNVISVPNGASPNAKMEYIENCQKELENIDEFILAMDEDAIGAQFRDELARRLGKEKCFKVSFKDCKDSNEYFIKYGKDSLLKVLENKQPYPIDGVFTVKDVREELFDLYKNGLSKGMTIGDPMDEFVSYELGRLYLITGVPGHGKSEYMDYVISKLTLKYGIKTAYYSPENYPIQVHISKIMDKFIGCPTKADRMSIDNFNKGCDFIEDKYYWIDPDENNDVDKILSVARGLVLTKGVNTLVMDPYNKMEHKRPSNMSETEYVSMFLDKVLRFAHKYDMLIFLVAHPKKMAKLATGLVDIPNLYDINGSSNFYNKTDFGITVYRNRQTGLVEVYLQKSKFRHLGTEGSTTYKYNLNNGRYSSFDGVDINDIQYDNSNWLEDKPVEQELPIPDNKGLEPVNFDNWDAEKEPMPF